MEAESPREISMRLGIDIGRVIIGPALDGAEDTSFLGTTVEEAMATPPAPGAFAAIRHLVERFEGAVWLVSKAGPSVQRKTGRWFEHHGFHAATGLGPDRVRFCLRRAEKADHCRQLGLTHFIDDRIDVLGYLEGIVEHRMLFGEQQQAVSAGLIQVRTWAEVLEWFENG